MVAHARRQRGITARVDTGIAARECDVGVAQDGEGCIAVVEASIHGAELDAIVTRVAVGEPGDVLTVSAGCGVGAKVDRLEGHCKGQ